jgi:hypothetical protein
VQRTGLRGTSVHGFRAATIFYPDFYPNRYRCRVEMPYLLVTVANCIGRPGSVTTLLSWSCGFDSRRPLPQLRGMFRKFLGYPLGAACPLRARSPRSPRAFSLAHVVVAASIKAMVNVTVEARNDVDNPGVVKLQGETWELNIWATTDELWKLADIEKTDWVQRRTLQIGTCAHAPVWWNELDGTVFIAIGHDDVTWDFGVTVPLSTVHNLIAELGEPPEDTPPPFGPTLF